MGAEVERKRFGRGGRVLCIGLEIWVQRVSVLRSYGSRIVGRSDAWSGRVEAAEAEGRLGACVPRCSQLD